MVFRLRTHFASSGHFIAAVITVWYVVAEERNRYALFGRFALPEIGGAHYARYFAHHTDNLWTTTIVYYV